MKCKRDYKGLIVAMALFILPLASVDGADIRVLVYGHHDNDHIVYHYTVVNNGDEEFNNFTIGSVFDAESGYDIPEIGRLPVGWRFGREGELGPQILLDATSTSQPTGWVAKVFGQSETDFFFLQWQLPPDLIVNGLKPIQRGQSINGFAVRVPKSEDPRMPFMPAGSEQKYFTGHFSVGYWSNQEHYKFRGAIEKRDVSPPALSITASPSNIWPPNNKLAPVTIAVSVQDDYDPQPEIKLESITANETLGSGDIAAAKMGTDDRAFSLKADRAGTNKAGRIYTITYSATDGTGNKSTASTTVTVPHDQGK